jgi:hypothetical protein
MTHGLCSFGNAQPTMWWWPYYHWVKRIESEFLCYCMHGGRPETKQTQRKECGNQVMSSIVPQCSLWRLCHRRRWRDVRKGQRNGLELHWVCTKWTVMVPSFLDHTSVSLNHTKPKFGHLLANHSPFTTWTNINHVLSLSYMARIIA